MIEYDAEMARRIEEMYTTPDVVEQRRAVLELLTLSAGERVIDVGVGPGLLTADIATAVGPTGFVCGVDASEDMLTVAGRRAAASKGAPIELCHGQAERIPQPDESFDVAVSTQVLEYVADISAALAELRRVLRPGGRVLLLDTDWDSIVWRSSDDARMERVLRAWEQHLADPHLPRRLAPSLEDHGFTVDDVRVLPLLNVGLEPETYSAKIAAIIAGFVVGRNELTSDDVDAWSADLRSMGPHSFFSLNRYIFCATKPGE